MTTHVAFCRSCEWRLEGTAHEAIAAGKRHIHQHAAADHDVAYLGRQDDE